ncbi:hypothetical protein [Agrococcus jejuensis]|uniref:Short C-terminal domain-containing protein n=1 Tax=Agrococcus jejuensis TaxID=399736 RepID=A0A1G8BY20_9MICO|nr:hypothetical protein [Agrococcus jejuensis]SDH37600.1 hypothetical protein SAMN04489720_1082 [Agrococcus jejuensis]
MPLILVPAPGLPAWASTVIMLVVVAAGVVGIVSMIMAMRRNRDLQDGAPPLPPRPWSQPSAETPLPGPPSPVAPDDVPLEQRLSEIDDAYFSGRIDASERERARRALLGDDPDEER